MKTNHQSRECDVQRLQSYLEGTLTKAEQELVEDHLCECQECRHAINGSAAEQDWWGDAGEYLRGDAWDDLLETSLFTTRLEESGNHQEGRHPLASRQIKEWLDPTDDPHMLGRFDGYEIVGIIGQGGMGVVLKGFERSLNRYVAIKVLAPHLATSGAARKRFAREAKATAAVLHDNVIPIHRVEEAHGLPYLVMPYVADIPLQQRIDEEGPLPLVAILRIGEQIAAGLAAAHAHGLVHRDIKPANILLETGVERVRITDFGLARAADDGSLTRTGVIAGTPQYMSPEQARGESVDARSDLFSLGSVLYAMATGRPPFRAETAYGILRRIIDTEPRSIREINPELPPWLAAIIAKLHAKRVEDRYASADLVAELLKRCLAHVEQPTSVALPKECELRTHDLRRTPDQPWWYFFHQRAGRLTVGLLATAALVGILITTRGLPPKPPRPSRASATQSAPDDTSTTKIDSKDDAASVAWDGTAEAIGTLMEEARPFEARAQQLWSAPSETAPATPISATTTTTSAQESNP